METINKNEANKAAILEILDALRSELRAEPSNPQLKQALEQSDRLQLAISQFHAEGLRFAAFTLFRMTLPPTTTFGAPVQAVAQKLKAALDSAGYPH
jgi:hypothetical protein